MVSKKRFVPALSAAAILAAATSGVMAQSYTLTFDDVVTGNYGAIPGDYQPSVLAGSGITVTFTDANIFRGDGGGVALTGDLDHTPGGNGSAMWNGTTVSVQFSQPVYVTSTWLATYMGFTFPSITAETAAIRRGMAVTAFTNPADVTPVASYDVTTAFHEHAGYGNPFIWRELISLAATPIQKITFSNPDGFPQIDDLTISTTPGSTLVGDFNRDGIVDIGDYTIWADTYDTWADPAFVGTPYVDQAAADANNWTRGVDLRADANLNGFVDIGDYTVWADSYGEGAAAAVLSLTAVPEPASLGLFGLAGAAMLYRRRK